MGLRVAREAFADRALMPDGTLVPRSKPGAVIHDTQQVIERSVRLVTEKTVVAITGEVVHVDADTLVPARRHAGRGGAREGAESRPRGRGRRPGAARQREPPRDGRRAPLPRRGRLRARRRIRRHDRPRDQPPGARAVPRNRSRPGLPVSATSSRPTGRCSCRTTQADEVRHAEAAARADSRVGCSNAAIPPPRVVEIPTAYGGAFGPDLAFVAEHNHLAEDEVDRHSLRELTTSST